MNIPSNLKYTKEHEWIRVEGEVAYVGITDYAQGELGEIVFVEIETVGETLAENATFGSVEAVKTVSDLFMPMSGEILEMNAARLNMEGNTDPKVARKQKELANKFRRFADKLSIQNKNASKEALYDVKDDEKEKYKIDDVTDSLPDSAASSLF